MNRPDALELEEVELRCSRVVAKLMVDDEPSLGEHGQVAEAQLSPDELRKLAAKCTEIADWLEFSQVLEAWGTGNVEFSAGDVGPTWDLEKLPADYWDPETGEAPDQTIAMWTTKGEAFMEWATARIDE